MLSFVLKNRFSWASRHCCPGTRTHKSLLVKAARHTVREGGQLIISRLHGSVLPSVRRASATSLLKTDRFWVNLWKEEERPRPVARRKLYEPLEDKATVELRTLERAPGPGWAPASRLHCSHYFWPPTPPSPPSPARKQGLPPYIPRPIWGVHFVGVLFKIKKKKSSYTEMVRNIKERIKPFVPGTGLSLRIDSLKYHKSSQR